MRIFAVCYSNYFPREIDSLWLNEADADEYLESLEGDWRIYEMEVRESLLTPDAADGADAPRPGWLGNINGVGADPDVP